MSSIDPAKLKVVELRAELTARGLESKGNKPVLVKRLKEALEKELEQEIPDTSILDTSTEEANSSQESIAEDVPNVPPDEDAEFPESIEQDPELKPEVAEEAKEHETEETSAEDLELEADEPLLDNDTLDDSPEAEVDEPKSEGNATSMEIDDVASSNPPADENESKTDLPEAEQTAVEEQSSKGEKRRRSSPSPERVQRRRSRTPVVEDEPVMDESKVLLSWYDSDLHLQVDKKSFLSGKPYHEGAFGYAWAGVRTTHGVKSGKACFEVKITEELKWDDLVKHSDKRRDNRRDRRDRRYERSSSRSDRTNSKPSRFTDIKIEEEKIEKDAESEKKEENSEKQGSEVDNNENGDEVTEVEKPTENVDEGQKSENGENSFQESENKEISNETEDISPEHKESVNETNEAAEEKMETDEPKVSETEEPKVSETEEPKVSETEELKVSETEEPKASETKENNVEKPQDEEVQPVEPIAKHAFRMGWSIIPSGLQLGEAEFSYGFESSGKFVTNKEFVDYGVKFGVGDVIGAYLDINEESVVLTFTHNGEALPIATTLNKSDLPDDFALFPHILTRNYSFELNLGGNEEPWFPSPADLEDYLYLEKLEDKVQGPVRPESRSECEVIMMCGLPASGKTHWVKEYIKENSDKKYNVIGNSHLLAKMTVNGNPLKNSYKGRWNVILDRLVKCVNVLVEVAAVRRRNYIIDQTNVFPSAQRRKMRLFEGYKRRAVVVVVADEEQTKRQALQEAQEGKDVPDSAILEMKANMSLPRRGDWLEEVSYIELNEEDAKALIQKYNQQGREAGFGPLNNQRSGGYRDNRGHPYRWDHSTSRRDYRGGYRDNRSYQNSRYDRSRQQSGWQNRRPPPGSWNRDVRRDGRGPSNSSRDFRNNNRSGGNGRQDRSGSRDNRNRNSGSSGSFNRNQRPQSSRNQSSSWQGSGGSGGGSSWQNQGGNWGNSQGMWNQQGGWGGQGNWSGQTQQWKSGYGGQQQGGGYGQGYGSYPNWNYYGQYAQNWNNSQGHPQTTVDGAVGATDKVNQASNQYSQSTAWAQYAQQQQYTQGEQTNLQQHQQPKLN